MYTLSRPLCHSIISAEKGRAPPLSPASARSKEGGFCLLTLPHAWMTHDALTLFLLCSSSSLALGATATHTSCLKKREGKTHISFFGYSFFFFPWGILGHISQTKTLDSCTPQMERVVLQPVPQLPFRTLDRKNKALLTFAILNKVSYPRTDIRDRC